MNESLPHLGAALFGHILGTAWTGFRVSGTRTFEDDYRKYIVNGPCQTDLLGSWWDLRLGHAVSESITCGIRSILTPVYF